MRKANSGRARFFLNRGRVVIMHLWLITLDRPEALAEATFGSSVPRLQVDR